MSGIPSAGAGLGVAVAAAEGADAVMGGASGRVGGAAHENGDLRVRHAGHMVVGNRLSLFGRERAGAAHKPSSGAPRHRLRTRSQRRRQPESPGGAGRGRCQSPCGAQL